MLSKLSWNDWESEVRKGLETIASACASPRKEVKRLRKPELQRKVHAIKTTISEFRKKQDKDLKNLVSGEDEDDISTAYGSDDEESEYGVSPRNNASGSQIVPVPRPLSTASSFPSNLNCRKNRYFQSNNSSILDSIVEQVLLNMSFANAAMAFGGVKGLLLGAAPPPASKPIMQQQNNNGQTVSLNMPPKEEEQFMELIFPGFEADTFIWNVTLFQIFWFGFTMLVGHNKANPTPCALYMLGASWGPAVARGQLWRLFCPMMLHANMMHLFFNVFFQLRIGFGMEKQFGKSKMRILYLACGVIGNLISVMLDPFKLAVGASTAGFGLIGVWIAEIFLSWEILGRNRDKTLIWILFMLVSVTTMSGMSPNMDLYGHFGGAFGGFLMAIIMSDMREDARPPWYNTAKKLAMSAFVLLLAAGFGKIFLLTPIAPLPDCAMSTVYDALVAHLPNLGIASHLPSVAGVAAAGHSLADLVPKPW